jgi:DHA2 family multidrug resistance protein
MSTVQALSAPQGLSMPTAKKIFAFASMCVGMFIALIDIQIVSASLRDIGGGLSAGDDETVWVQTSYLIAEIIIIPLSGWLARVMSTRWLFAASAAGFTLMSLLCGWAWNIQSMIAFRALQGLAGGSMIPLVFTTAFAFFRANSGSLPRRRSAAWPPSPRRWAQRWAAGSPKTTTGTGCSLSTLFRGFTSRWQCRCW